MEHTTPPALQEVYLRVERAREQFQVLQAETTAFIQSNPQGPEVKLKDKGNDIFHVFVLARINEWPPPRLGILAGEVVHHLHAALDHIVYALSERRWASQSDLRDVAFPIFQDPSVFSARTRRGRPAPTSGHYKMRFVQPAAQAVIKSLQPYHTGKNALLHPLWVLQELSNIEKHRRLHILSPPIGGVKLTDELGPFELLSTEEFGIRPLKDGTIIAKAVIRVLPGFEGKVRVKTYLPPHVAFEEAIPLPQRYASEILQDILGFVEGSVLPPLARFF